MFKPSNSEGNGHHKEEDHEDCIDRLEKPKVEFNESRIAAMHYILIQGPSYRGLGFEAREEIREDLRRRLEGCGIRFMQYDWVWDEEDRCLLLVGQYESIEDGRHWIKALQSLGFTVFARTGLPGDETC